MANEWAPTLKRWRNDVYRARYRSHAWTKKFHTLMECHRRGGLGMTMEELVSKWNEQGKMCALSGAPLKPRNTSLDHIVATSSGGSNTPDNIQLVDETVNYMKHNMTNEDFINVCARVAAHSFNKITDPYAKEMLERRFHGKKN